MTTTLTSDDLHHLLDKETFTTEQASLDSDSSSSSSSSSSNCEEHSHTPPNHLTTQTNDWILQHWPFASTAAQTSYLSKDLPGLACLCFPSALADRMHLIARLFAITFLLGEMIAGLDADDAGDGLRSLQEATNGYWEVDPRTHAAEVWMLCDVMEEMRGHEYALTGDVMEAVWNFLSLRVAQRGRRRRTKRHDATSGFQTSFVDAGLLLPLHRFATGVMVDEEEWEYSMTELEHDDLSPCAAAELQAIVNA